MLHFFSSDTICPARLSIGTHKDPGKAIGPFLELLTDRVWHNLTLQTVGTVEMRSEVSSSRVGSVRSWSFGHVHCYRIWSQVQTKNLLGIPHLKSLPHICFFICFEPDNCLLSSNCKVRNQALTCSQKRETQGLRSLFFFLSSFLNASDNSIILFLLPHNFNCTESFVCTRAEVNGLLATFYNKLPSKQTFLC